MLYHPGKIASFSRLTLDRGIAAVVVGFPATHLLTARARICISASHTRQDLDCALKVSVCELCLSRLFLRQFHDTSTACIADRLYQLISGCKRFV